MRSKSEILSRIRNRLLVTQPLPSLEGEYLSFPDREQQFLSVLASVGGQAQVVPDLAQLNAAISELPCLNGAQKIICTVPGVNMGNCELGGVADPHELADLDVAILAGEFAVAENGAVWLTDRGLRQRAVYFITQHLVLVVPRARMLDNLHQAYESLRFEEAGYGLFMSGPSKTADIEQSLVIGAHGPRSLTVFLLGESPSQ